jgi:hypothetical protein
MAVMAYECGLSEDALQQELLHAGSNDVVGDDGAQVLPFMTRMRREHMKEGELHEREREREGQNVGGWFRGWSLTWGPLGKRWEDQRHEV